MLAGILGNAEIALLTRDPARMETALKVIVKNSRELKGSNERLVVFARTVEPARRCTNLLDLYRQLFGFLERSFRKYGVEIEERYASDLPATWCDTGAASQLLLFMLRMALESLSEAGGGRMRLEASSTEDHLVFSVRFEPAPGRESDVTHRRLGALTFELASTLAAEQGGSLSVERVGPAWQTTCRFPVLTAEEAYGAEQRPATTVEERGRSEGVAGLSVLVVEDDGSIRELIREVLEQFGCRVETVEDADAALASYRKSRSAIVLTDAGMTTGDGRPLIRTLRTLDPGATIVAVTGSEHEVREREALAHGALKVLRKPFELPDLIALVRWVAGSASDCLEENAMAGAAPTIPRTPTGR